MSTTMNKMKSLLKTLAAMLLLGTMAEAKAQEAVFAPLEASDEAKSWYQQGQWRQGFAVEPYEQMDVQTFYEQYQKAPQMWDSIFSWLGSIDPLTMETSNKAMEWSHAYVKVLDQKLRTPENCQWEQHRRTIDLQWDCTGSERYHMTHSPECLVPKNEYNEKKDVQNFQWNKDRVPTAEECLVIDSDPGHFYLFFPNDIHQATGIGRQPCVPRKIVVKIDVL